ncbi:hypothetical protein CPLU01_05311 [Colletotrichum plurivorum]|uniref:Uncharacterized protein n=1 Tax=Colletotrichum plurivorum TaxID=2175906 RepID=A0A8H6KN76_9PEZI|nr:hypothetical protein CPLU01_05311 [Colletotrichum plurivorum]
MRNLFKQKKVRQSWEGRPRALTVDDPVFKDLDRDEIDSQIKQHRSSAEAPARLPSRQGAAAEGFRPSTGSDVPQYNHHTTLGFASIAGALAAADAGSSTHGADTGADTGMDAGADSSSNASSSADSGGNTGGGDGGGGY